jgi:beclin 1
MLDQSQSSATSRATYQPTSADTPSAGAGPSAPRQGLSSTELAETLHRLISSKTPISHPICVECITLLQSELQTELDELQKERDAYIAFEQGILRNREVVQGGRSKTAQKEREKHTKGKGKGRAVEEVQGVDEGLGEFDMEGTQEEWDMLIRRKKELAEEEERLIAELKKREGDLEAVREEEEGVRRDEEEVDREEQEYVPPPSLSD